MDRFTGAYVNRVEDHPTDFRRKRIRASQAPAGEARAWLEARRAALRASLGSTPGPALTAVLTLLLGASREYGSLSPKAAGMRLALYAEALTGVPIWAVEQARKTFGKGGWRCLWDGNDVPSSHDVVAECRHILLPIETELARLDAVLDAEPYSEGATDDERVGAVGHWWNEVRPGIQGESVLTEQTEDEISAERASMARANERFRERARIEAAAQGRGQAMWGRLPISDELARKIGLRVPIPADHEEEVH
ncbi:hypothetical protein [Methylobacterium fujisawaense]|uniref:hypothetical protein n=1 Tax=Methylobacterium fujisawaense TaxID=107400 RepID=UPI00313DBA2D